MKWKTAALLLPVALLLLLLASAQLGDSFQFSKAVEGKLNNNRTFSLHVNVPPEYDSVWLMLTFASNRTCNATVSYSVVQYHETVRRGNTSIRWSFPLKRGRFVIPLKNLDNEFDIYANMSFCW